MRRISPIQEGVSLRSSPYETIAKGHRMAVYDKIINRDGSAYKQKHYRAHWQPLWAFLGLLLCSLLMIFGGWAAIYDLAVDSPGVDRKDAIVDLVAAYLGVSNIASKSKSRR